MLRHPRDGEVQCTPSGLQDIVLGTSSTRPLISSMYGTFTSPPVISRKGALVMSETSQAQSLADVYF